MCSICCINNLYGKLATFVSMCIIIALFFSFIVSSVGFYVFVLAKLCLTTMYCVVNFRLGNI